MLVFAPLDVRQAITDGLIARMRSAAFRRWLNSAHFIATRSPNFF